MQHRSPPDNSGEILISCPVMRPGCSPKSRPVTFRYRHLPGSVLNSLVTMKWMVAIRLLAVGILPVFATSAQQTRIDSEQLQSAVSKGHRLGSEQYGVAAVEELLDRGLNVNAKDGAGWTALMMASL